MPNIVIVIVDSKVMWEQYVLALHWKATRLTETSLEENDILYIALGSGERVALLKAVENREVVQVQRFKCSFPDNQVAAQVMERMRQSEHPKPCIYVDCS